jgi:hypothetical protein
VSFRVIIQLLNNILNDIIFENFVTEMNIENIFRITNADTIEKKNIILKLVNQTTNKNKATYELYQYNYAPIYQSKASINYSQYELLYISVHVHC